MRTTIITAALALAISTPGLAQEGSALGLEDDIVHGEYLTDGAGRPVYAFSADRTGEAPATIACRGECMENWPPVTSTGLATPEAGVDPSLIGALPYEEYQVVTYNGWPLYYFAADGGADRPQGQGVEAYGGTWSLITPAGEPLAE